jgi:SAM-dependent methyltransferase
VCNVDATEVLMPSFAMKVYDLQWFTTFGMGYDEAAAALVEDGIDTVLTQNRIDSLPHSGVDQTTYLAAYGERLAAYDDREWLAALRRHGRHVLETTAMLFDPRALERFPDARPVNALGEPDAGIDWYVGVCPTHEAYLEVKLDLLRQVGRDLVPDGIFLQFMRYPGFWENWTWSPDYRFTDADRLCFCDRCRSLFARSIDVELPPGSVAEQAGVILNEYRALWNAWREARIADIMERARHALEQYASMLMLNTLPFPRSDFDGLDVRAQFAAQNLGLLAASVDRFELMTYLQILNRPVSWLRTAIADARALLPPGRELVCTVQVDALYTTGVHAARQRRSTVTGGDLLDAARTALDAGADGLVFYHWTDFLKDEAAGGTKRQVLRAVTRG